MELQEIVSKLNASRNLLQRKLQRIDTDQIQVEPVEIVYQRYAEIRSLLRTDYPSLFDDLPDHPIPSKIKVKGGYWVIPKYHVWQLLENINYCLDLLSTVQSPTSLAASITREGIFFAGQYFDALSRITGLITQAQKNIIIIDGYINDDVLNLLTAKDLAVTIRILTKSAKPSLITSAKAFDKQYRGLSVRTSQTFHDRFVIVDEHDFFHFGASIKDLGNRGFMFSRIEEPLVTSTLLTEFNKEWAKSTIVI